MSTAYEAALEKALFGPEYAQCCLRTAQPLTDCIEKWNGEQRASAIMHGHRLGSITFVIDMPCDGCGMQIYTNVVAAIELDEPVSADA